jgi:Uma2 family endonuclease
MKRSPKMAEDLVSVNEFYRLVPDGQKADLIDGVIYLASPDSRRSNSLTKFLCSLMHMYEEAKNLGGEVFFTRFAFRLTKYRAASPDVAYVRPGRVHLIREREMKGPPDIAVEVASRDSRLRDYVEKMALYQKAGVEEFWIVDPLKHRAEFHRLSNKAYNLVPLEANRIFRSQVLAGFWLDVNWLLAKPLPNAYQCLLEILR